MIEAKLSVFNDFSWTHSDLPFLEIVKFRSNDACAVESEIIFFFFLLDEAFY
jgi:hypothetical protein